MRNTKSREKKDKYTEHEETKDVDEDIVNEEYQEQRENQVKSAEENMKEMDDVVQNEENGEEKRENHENYYRK